jgi:hypothetical protein
MSCFVLFFLLFSSTKSENRRGEQVLSGGRVDTHGRREVIGKGGKRVNTLQKCVHIYVKCVKMISFETIPGIRGEGIKENGKEGEFMCVVFDTL